MTATAIGALALAAWAYLLLARGRFWRAADTDAAELAAPAEWPAVAAVVPARDEAEVIAASIGSLVVQDYPGPFRVILVDDDSSDGTADVARATAEGLGYAERLEIVRSLPLPGGWTGKLWAMAQGAAEAGTPKYLLLTDADIDHAPANVRRLVARAEAGRLVLTSLMAKLHCATGPERMLVPAFVFFFQMLYPFQWAADPRRKLAAAAGGCMLVERRALEAAGGLKAIRTSIIDDCALAAAMKRQGPIWIGLTHRARSIRPYVTVAEIGRMISRSAFAQLDYSALALAATLAGLGLVFVAPAALTLFTTGWAQLLGALAWLAMAAAFQPMLRFYRRSALWGAALPLIASLYAAFTLRSALDVWRGRGGLWKGRAQAMARPA